MHAPVIDTLKFAERLKKAGFESTQAEGLARALSVELAESMVTKRDLDEAVQALRMTIETANAKFESRFEGLESRFGAVDVRFEGLESRFDAVDVRFEGLESRFGAVESRFEGLESRFGAVESRFEGLESRFGAVDVRFDAVDAKLESQHREFSGRLNVLFGTMALGFTLIIGLIGYSLFSPRPADPGVSAIEHIATGPSFR